MRSEAESAPLTSKSPASSSGYKGYKSRRLLESPVTTSACENEGMPQEKSTRRIPLIELRVRLSEPWSKICIPTEMGENTGAKQGQARLSTLNLTKNLTNKSLQISNTQ
jgi:hypothetical protein